MDDLKKLQKQIASLLASGKAEPDFFEVVRRFDQQHPELPRTGYAERSKSDILHFGQVPALYFPEGAMDSLQEGPDRTLRLLVNFFGLSGVHGPLPLEYTSMVFQRTHNHYDRSMQRFLDIFNHAFLRLYYRAYADHNAAICCDRPEENRTADLFKVLLAQPEGVTCSRRQQYAWMSVSAFLGDSRRSSFGLHGILTALLHLPVRIEERVTGRCSIPQQYRCHLGVKENALLGVNTQIGKRFLCNTRKINIHFGPLNFSRYFPFLPGKQLFFGLASIIMRYMDRPLDFDFVVRLKTDTLPRACLNGAVALSQSAWLGGTHSAETTVRIEASRIFVELYQKCMDAAGSGDGCPPGSRFTDFYRNQKYSRRKEASSWETPPQS